MENLQITNYSIKNSIGQGGMATVYLAEDIKFQTNVAIKVLNKEYVHNDNIRKRFIAEARNMFKMSHPNIIKVNDLIDDGDTVAFVMEYIEGETLKEYLDRKGKLSDDEIKNLFSQMLEAVGYVHKQNLIHRDIKPSNFMINGEGQIKLMDFGIAKNTDTNSADYTQTGTSQNMGTPMYMSPEQIKSTKDVTLQSDIYSLGVVLWQMVMGKKPYDTNTTSTFELQMKIVQDELPSTSKYWDSIIQKATAKDVLNRYETCLEIKKALSKISELEEKTMLSNASEKTIVEPNVVEKGPKVRKRKTVVEVQENSKHNKKGTIKINKYWFLFLVFVPILLFSIYKYPFKSEETPSDEEMCYLEPFEDINKLHGYKCNDSIIIAATYTATDYFKDGKARVSRNDSLFYIDENGKMIEFLGFIENKLNEKEDQKEPIPNNIIKNPIQKVKEDVLVPSKNNDIKIVEFENRSGNTLDFAYAYFRDNTSTKLTFIGWKKMKPDSSFRFEISTDTKYLYWHASGPYDGNMQKPDKFFCINPLGAVECESKSGFYELDIYNNYTKHIIK